MKGNQSIKLEIILGEVHHQYDQNVTNHNNLSTKAKTSRREPISSDNDNSMFMCNCFRKECCTRFRYWNPLVLQDMTMRQGIPTSFLTRGKGFKDINQNQSKDL